MKIETYEYQYNIYSKDGRLKADTIVDMINNHYRSNIPHFPVKSRGEFYDEVKHCNVSVVETGFGKCDDFFEKFLKIYPEFTIVEITRFTTVEMTKKVLG